MKKKSYDNYNYNKYLFTNYHNYQISTLDKKKKKIHIMVKLVWVLDFMSS